MKELKKNILSILKQNKNKKYNHIQISSVLGIYDPKQRKKIIRIIQNLIEQNIIKSIDKGKFKYYINKKNTFSGTLQLTSTGRGFVIVDDMDSDVMVNKIDLNKAFDGDYVKVNVFNNKKRIEGEIIEILKRNKKEFIGEFKEHKNSGFVLTQNKNMYTDFYISDKDIIVDVEEGDKVLVKFKDWPKNTKNPFGRIIKNLGKKGEIDTEIKSLLNDFKIKEFFNEQILNATKKINIKIDRKEINIRKDIRDILTLTIDPDTAKDFDDAISIKKIDNKKYEIGIHIADVSHYVNFNSEIDKEALKRGNSIYLVDRVIPMLPEKLSNEVCSLRPNEDKLTFSAMFELNEKGTILNEWYGKTIINSDYRFTYDEIQSVIDNNSPVIEKKVSLKRNKIILDVNTFNSIIFLNKIAKKYREKRLEKGAIFFDKKEVGFILDRKKNPQKIILKKQKEANKLVEEFMLLANRKVAEYCLSKNTKNVYRVHDKPDIDKIKNLKKIAGAVGFDLKTEENKISKSINELLFFIKGKNEENLINNLALRAMSKAEYNTNNIGHYGLGFENYVHFTSPIRRYSDVLVHRILHNKILNKNKVDVENLNNICIHISNKEKEAVKIERESIKLMQIKYLEKKEGLTSEGVVSGLTERAIYIELTNSKAEGLVRVKDLKDDFYIYNEKKHKLFGRRTNKIIQLGDLVEVIIKKVDINKRQIDLEMI